MRPLAVFIAATLGVASFSTQAADPAPADTGSLGSLSSEAGAIDWLLTVSEAARHASYEGVVVYRDADMLETLRIIHRHKDGREQERLTSLNGPARDVFREDDHVTCILARNHAHDLAGNPAHKPQGPQTQGIFPAMSRDTLTQVAGHYEFRDLGQARVAGRACRGVAITPRDEFRYGYAVWADAVTSVPLKVSLLDRQGRAVEEMLFTRVAFPASIPDQAFAIPAGKKGYIPPREPASNAALIAAAGVNEKDLRSPALALGAAPAWASQRLPPGFRITMRSLKPTPDGQGMIEHVLLSDGLSAVSVFSARVPLQEKRFRGMSHMGAMHAYGRMLGTLHITVVGEVPQSTVRLIGDSLQPAETSGTAAATAAEPETIGKP